MGTLGVLTDKWEVRLLDLAEYISQWSRDPSPKVGAVVADGKRVVSVGYNGFPAGVKDLTERYSDRDTKYKMIVHGEVNAMTYAREPLTGFTLYTWPFMPCSVCAGIVIQSGIKTVVAPYNDRPDWQDSFRITRQMFEEAGVRLHECLP